MSRLEKTSTDHWKQITPKSWLMMMLPPVLLIAMGHVATLAAPPPGKGKDKDDSGGNAAFVSLMVTIESGFPISADNHPMNVYVDGIDSVGAFAGEGFRFDTDGTGKIINNKQVRYVNFDFSDTALAVLSPELLPVFPATAEPGVDARIGQETDENGNNPTSRLDLRLMAPGDTRYCRFVFKFGFENSDGLVESWQLAYGPTPGTDGDGYDYGDVVQVTAVDSDSDESVDTWTISGHWAGLRLMSDGQGPDLNQYQGPVQMPFELTLDRLD